MQYVASADPRESRAENFRNLILTDEANVSVILPGRTKAIQVPTKSETNNYWLNGPDAFSSNERFEEVRAYMRHYFVDADSAQEYWEQRKRVNAEIAEQLKR